MSQEPLVPKSLERPMIKMFKLLFEWTFRLTMFGFRSVRRGTVSAMPKPKAQPEAVRNAIIAFAAWTLNQS